MMSCIQTNVIAHNANIGKTYSPLPWLSQLSYRKDRHTNVSASLKVEHHKEFPKLVCSSLGYKRFSPICSSGRTGNSKRENEPFSWDSLKRVFGGFKQELTVQDLLREQKQRQEFDGNGGNGGSTGGDGYGFGGGEDEGSSGMLEEFLQVVLATIGLIFVYIYLIRGAELTRLARDYIKYLFGGTASVRLRRAMDDWEEFWQGFVWTGGPAREDWLERAIVATPTWWHNPHKLVRAMEQILRAHRGESEPPPPPPPQTQKSDSDYDYYGDDENNNNDDDEI